MADTPKALQTAEEHTQALVEIRCLWDSSSDIDGGLRLIELMALVEEYEEEHCGW